MSECTVRLDGHILRVGGGGECMEGGSKQVPLLCHDLVKRMFRCSKFRTLNALSIALKVTPAHVSQLVIPPDEGGRLPSKRIMNLLARVCGRSAGECEWYRRLLYQAKWAVEYSSTPVRVSESMLPPLKMPRSFCDRLRRDISGMGVIRQRTVARSAEVTYRHLSQVLQGEGVMDRWQVTRLAQQLGQDVGIYLKLAGYVTSEAQPLFARTGGLPALTSLSRDAYNELFSEMFGSERGVGRRH